MVRLIMSGSGEGKTKQLLELMDSAAETSTGCMVCIEPTRNMSFSLRHQTRLVDASEFSINSFDSLRGFICGLYAGNYDISHIFIDDLYKTAPSASSLTGSIPSAPPWDSRSPLPSAPTPAWLPTPCGNLCDPFCGKGPPVHQRGAPFFSIPLVSMR